MSQSSKKRGSIEFSPLVCSNIAFLKALAKTKSDRKKRQILRRATTAQLLCIVEICLNLVKNRFLGLSARQKTRIIPYLDFVRRMSRVRTEHGARKMVQKGEGVGAGVFAAILAPIIVEFAKNFLKEQSQP